MSDFATQMQKFAGKRVAPRCQIVYMQNRINFIFAFSSPIRPLCLCLEAIKVILLISNSKTCLVFFPFSKSLFDFQGHWCYPCRSNSKNIIKG